MVNSILYCEINALCILVLILLSLKLKRSMFFQRQRHVLYMLMITNIVFYLVDGIWIFVNNDFIGNSISLNWFLNSTYYILSGVLGYLWFIYSETVQNSKLVTEKKYTLLTMLPMLALSIMTLLSWKTKWLFYIDANNLYHRGPAYFLQLLCAYGYIIFAACKSLYLSIHTDNYQKKVQLRTLFIFVIPTLLAGGLQVIFSGYPILCIGNTFSILYVYVTQQEHLISVDPLTKLNNRNQLFQYLSTRLAHVNENRNLYLLIMDIDYFKSINDQYGHVEGDEALKKIASCLIKACREKHYFISRYGGDEFIMICELEADESIQRVCNAIHYEVEHTDTPYHLSVSIGIAKYASEIKTQQEFIAKADAELYKVKQSRPAR